MANPELSRRIARVISIMMEQGLSIEERFDLATRAESATKLEDLPNKYIILIKKAETQLYNQR